MAFSGVLGTPRSISREYRIFVQRGLCSAWIIELCRKIYVGALDAIVKVQPK